MTVREITGPDIAAIKTASRVLVREVGGLEAAAIACRWGKSAIAEGYDPHRPDRTLPVDVVADLERCAPQPFVTAVLARLSGHALVPVAEPTVLEARAIAAVFRDAAHLGEAYAVAMEDAALSDAERQALADRVLALQAACLQAAASLMAKKVERA